MTPIVEAGRKGYRFARRIRLRGELASQAEETRHTVVSPTGHATSALVTRVYLVVQAYAALRFRPWGRWQVKSGPSG